MKSRGLVVGSFGFVGLMLLVVIAGCGRHSSLQPLGAAREDGGDLVAAGEPCDASVVDGEPGAKKCQ